MLRQPPQSQAQWLTEIRRCAPCGRAIPVDEEQAPRTLARINGQRTPPAGQQYEEHDMQARRQNGPWAMPMATLREWDPAWAATCETLATLPGAQAC